MIQNGMVAYPTEKPIKEPIIETSGSHRQLSGIEDAKLRNRAREPMERVITSPDIIRSGRLPARSTKLMDTGKHGVNYWDLFGSLTSCGNQLDTSNNSSAGILVNAATNSLKHIDSLEDNNVNP